MNNEIVEFIKKIDKMHSLGDLMKDIPKLVSSITKYLDKEQLLILKKEVLKNCPKKNKQIKKDAFKFVIKIWDICPEILKLELVCLLYLTKFINHDMFNFTLISGIISYHRFEDSSFNKNIKKLLNSQKSITSCSQKN